MANARPDGLQRLRDRGALADLLDAIVASGLPGEAARSAVEACGFFNWLRLAINSHAPLSARERSRLEAVVALAREVAADEGGPEGARRFWEATMPWLNGRSPAHWLARGDIGAIEDLRLRINHGIPP